MIESSPLFTSFLIAALVIFVYMVLFFIASLIVKDMGIADIGWGMGFVCVAAILFVVNKNQALTQVLTLSMVVIWGARLSIFLFIRNYGKPEDFRYNNWRKEWGNMVVLRSFLQVFMLQGAIMLINVLPITVTLTSQEEIVAGNLWFLSGSLLWIVGFGFEAIGDWQKYRFKKQDEHQGAGFITSGLWKYTRHPNYFGEVLLWWGFFLISVPFGSWYFSILGPAIITFLLLRVSGIPMLEEKYEGNEAYQKYKKKTSAFIPWFPKSG